jgi:hypothetical protein
MLKADTTSGVTNVARRILKIHDFNILGYTQLTRFWRSEVEEVSVGVKVYA